MITKIKKTIIILIVVLMGVFVFWYSPLNVYATDTGPNNPGTMADDATVGTIAWSNPDNAKVSDDSYATVTVVESQVVTHYLKATNFGFSIPAGATIDGILVEIEKKSVAQIIMRDSAVRIVKADASFGATNKGDTVSNWPNTDTYVSYGASNDLWDEAWTAEDINNANFGVVLSADLQTETTIIARVDHIRITVTYTAAVARVSIKGGRIQIKGGTLKIK